VPLKEMEKVPMRILFVAMSDSIHVARWISQLTEQGWELYIFSSTNNLMIHPDLRNVTIYKNFFSYQKNIDKSVKMKGIPVIFNVFVKIGNFILKMVVPDFNRIRLNHVIARLKPDIIHSMEFQAAGYLTSDVKKKYLSKFPFWIATNWGSDIYLFHHDPGHLKKIQDILKDCDYYLSECRRDVTLAKELGLKGKVLPMLPAAGGFDLEYFSRIQKAMPPSNRRIILLKGYHGWAGRALIGLEALKLCSSQLNGYSIVVYLASADVITKINKFSKETGIQVKIIPHRSHEELMRYFGQARIHIGLSISDGMPNTLMEAMILGAFPIQSDTSCADELIENGKSGLIVPPENVIAIAAAIKRALDDDYLVNDAANINFSIARDRLDKSIIQPKVITMYNEKINLRS
jgi:glycosyltransferase involved in cell wall biosynthesis